MKPYPFPFVCILICGKNNNDDNNDNNDKDDNDGHPTKDQRGVCVVIIISKILYHTIILPVGREAKDILYIEVCCIELPITFAFRLAFFLFTFGHLLSYTLLYGSLHNKRSLLRHFTD